MSTISINMFYFLFFLIDHNIWLLAMALTLQWNQPFMLVFGKWQGIFQNPFFHEKIINILAKSMWKNKVSKINLRLPFP